MARSNVTVDDYSPRVYASIATGINKWVRDTTAQVELETVKELNRLVYDTPESPTYKRTGNLRKSVTKHYPSETEGIVQAQIDYAIYVHEGTPHMPPRPYMRNAVEKVKREAGTDLHRKIEMELR